MIFTQLHRNHFSGKKCQITSIDGKFDKEGILERFYTCIYICKYEEAVQQLSKPHKNCLCPYKKRFFLYPAL